MMNHFVISNWYDPTDGASCETNDTGVKIDQYCGTVYDSNRFVKILKYYSGATLEGTVTLDGIGPVPNARILIERDAFSGEEEKDENGEVIDRDSRTFWIPIGTTQADDNGDFHSWSHLEKLESQRSPENQIWIVEDPQLCLEWDTR